MIRKSVTRFSDNIMLIKSQSAMHIAL